MPLAGMVRWGRPALPIVALSMVVASLGAGLGSPLQAQAPGSEDADGVVISEVLADAGRGTQEAASEWVEIFNPTPAAIDLEGWSLADNRGEDLLPAIVLAAGARVVVGGSEALRDEFGEGVGLVWVGDGRIGNGLANSGDRVLLLDPAGQAVDGVSWGSDRTITILAVPPRGKTLGRGRDDVWTAGAPSPGSAGVVAVVVTGAPAALRIVEIFANAGEGSRDAAFEWVEILNAGEEPVDLSGWQLSDNASTDVLPSTPSLRLGPGERLVLAATSEAAGTAGAGIRVLVEDGRLGNGLANGGDVVTLRDPAGRVVDEVDYRTPPLPRPEAGRSIALTEGALTAGALTEGALTDAGWVLNTEPSPGTAAVTPLLAGLAAGQQSREDDPLVTQGGVEAEDGGGIPAWALVAIALGMPLAAIGGRGAWRRRRPARVQSEGEQ